jgi:hypothetical protein
MKPALVAFLVVVLFPVTPVWATWSPHPAGPTGIDVNCTVVYQGDLHVGTTGGIAVYDGAAWAMVYHPESQSVYQLLEHDGKLFALTWTEVWTWNGAVWEQASPASLGEAVYAMDVDVVTGELYLGTMGAVVIVGEDGSTTTLELPSWIDQFGLTAYGGEVVVRDWLGYLFTWTGAGWREVSSSHTFYIYNMMCLGPRGLYIANSSGQMPIDIASGEPTADSHACDQFADVQPSADRQ